MVRCLCLFFLITLFALSSLSFAQNQLDPRPLDPEKDPDIDMFMGCWTESNPRVTHGTLIERDILTKGNALTPPRRGAVMEYVNRFAYGTLPAHNTTVSTALKGQQEAFYVLSGKGTVTGGGKTDDLFDGICFFVPEGLEFTIANTADEMLVMYLIVEPTPPGFTPKKDIAVKDEKAMPLRDQGYLKVHWSHNGENSPVIPSGKKHAGKSIQTRIQSTHRLRRRHLFFKGVNTFRNMVLAPLKRRGRQKGNKFYST